MFVALKQCNISVQRFANILLFSKSSHKTIWNVVKNVRSKYLTADCPYRGLYSDVVSQVLAVEKQLQLNSSALIQENMTASKLEAAGKMFMYLNSCSDILKPWFLFYTELLQNKPLDEVILTLNRISKSDKNLQSKELIKISNKLFERLSSLFSLKYQEIQNITQGVETLPLSMNNYSFKGA